jgi:hypothetical protein
VRGIVVSRKPDNNPAIQQQKDVCYGFGAAILAMADCGESDMPGREQIRCGNRDAVNKHPALPDKRAARTILKRALEGRV